MTLLAVAHISSLGVGVVAAPTNCPRSASVDSSGSANTVSAVTVTTTITTTVQSVPTPTPTATPPETNPTPGSDSEGTAGSQDVPTSDGGLGRAGLEEMEVVGTAWYPAWLDGQFPPASIHWGKYNMMTFAFA